MIAIDIIGHLGVAAGLCWISWNVRRYTTSKADHVRRTDGTIFSMFLLVGAVYHVAAGFATIVSLPWIVGEIRFIYALFILFAGVVWHQRIPKLIRYDALVDASLHRDEAEIRNVVEQYRHLIENERRENGE